MITSTGENLSVLITADYREHHDWSSFAAWYTIHNSLPDAKIALLCSRNLENHYIGYQWPYRSDLRFFLHENIGRRIHKPEVNKLYAVSTAIQDELVSMPLMVVDYCTIAVRPFSKQVVESLNDPSIKFAVGGGLWYFKDQPAERFISALNRHREFTYEKGDSFPLALLTAEMSQPLVIGDLCADCRSPEQASFIQFGRSCGKFEMDKWMKEKQGSPFHCTNELADDSDSLNERCVFESWRQMRNVYDVMR